MQEEVHWFQKSRCKLNLLGDRNIKYFHTATVIRRSKNRNSALKEFDGEWANDQQRLREIVIQFSSKLYLEENQVAPSYEVVGCFSNLPGQARREWELDVTEDEVKNSLFQMNPYKAPGVDGLQALFYQKKMGYGR